MSGLAVALQRGEVKRAYLPLKDSMSDFMDAKSYDFVVPKKAILHEGDLEKFKESQVCKDILDFIKLMAESVIGISIKNPGTNTIYPYQTPHFSLLLITEYQVCPVVRKFQTMMGALYALIDEIPPLKQPMRFGNKAFRQWHERLVFFVEQFLKDEDVLPVGKQGAVAELTPYFMELFGNETRIDYGTGHELNFAIIFFIFFRLQVIKKEDLTGVVLVGFASYIRTVR